MKSDIIKIQDLKKVANFLIRQAENKFSDQAVVLALSGDLGAGKTTLTQNIGQQLGVKNKIISPTFVIMKKYQIKNKKFKELIHIDTYRMEKKEEIKHLNWSQIISDKNNLIIVEWPELIKELIPKEVIEVKIKHLDKNTREIIY